jgi:hypothetical protein
MTEDINRQIEQLANEVLESSDRVEEICNEARDLRLQKALADQALAELANGSKQPQDIVSELEAGSIEMLEREQAELKSRILATEEVEQAIYREEAIKGSDNPTA